MLSLDLLHMDLHKLPLYYSYMRKRYGILSSQNSSTDRQMQNTFVLNMGIHLGPGNAELVWHLPDCREWAYTPKVQGKGQMCELCSRGLAFYRPSPQKSALVRAVDGSWASTCCYLLAMS